MSTSVPPRSTPPPSGPATEPPSWSTWREALAVVCCRPHLRKTVLIALVVGTILFCINQLDVVLHGNATTTVWVKAGVTYLVPFCVSNAGVLVASHRTAATGTAGKSPSKTSAKASPKTSAKTSSSRGPARDG